MGKDNIVFHTVIWPSMLIGYGEGGELGAGRGPLQLPVQRRRERVPDDGGPEVPREPRRRHLRPRLPQRYDPDALRYFLTAAGPETQDTDFTWAEFVRRTTTSSSRPGATSSTGRSRTPTATSARSRAGRARRRDAALLAAIEGGFATVGDAHRGRASRPRSGRRCSSRGASTSTSTTRRRGRSSRRSRPRRDRALRLPALRRQPEDDLHAVPAVQLAALHELLGYDGCLAGPLEFREVEEEGDRTSSSPATTPAGSARGSRASSSPGQALASRRRSSASSTRGSSTRSSSGWQARPRAA